MHERAAVLHEQVVQFQKARAEEERKLGREAKAEEIEERAERALTAARPSSLGRRTRRKRSIRPRDSAEAGA